jgi:pentapeptide repeat protein
MKFEIKSRFAGKILFKGDFGSLKLCVEAAVKARADLADADLAGADLADADLADAYLAGADLADANLAGADLADAYLARANLAGAYLAGANLAGANLARAYLADANLARAKNLPIPSAEEIARLDQVRDIVLAKPERLQMSNWHSGNWTPEHTPEEEHGCGSAHCIAGWLQALSPDKKVREMSAERAGYTLAPASSFMFYQSDPVALQWLKDRVYAKIAEQAKA